MREDDVRISVDAAAAAIPCEFWEIPKIDEAIRFVRNFEQHRSDAPDILVGDGPESVITFKQATAEIGELLTSQDFADRAGLASDDELAELAMDDRVVRVLSSDGRFWYPRRQLNGQLRDGISELVRSLRDANENQPLWVFSLEVIRGLVPPEGATPSAE